MLARLFIFVTEFNLEIDFHIYAHLLLEELGTQHKTKHENVFPVGWRTCSEYLTNISFSHQTCVVTNPANEKIQRPL